MTKEANMILKNKYIKGDSIIKARDDDDEPYSKVATVKGHKIDTKKILHTTMMKFGIPPVMTEAWIQVGQRNQCETSTLPIQESC